MPFIDLLHKRLQEYHLPFIKFAFWSGHFGSRKTLDVLHEHLWEYSLPFIEFTYDWNVHATTKFSPIEIVYRLNKFPPLDLKSSPVDDMGSLDGLVQIFEQINENAYLMDLPGKYHVSTIFNGTNHFPFDPGGDSRSNPFEERGNDGNQGGLRLKDMLQVPDGPNTSSRA